jgi:L-amino acid N-acyltransferase YncA
MTEILNALVTTTAIEWTDELYSVEERSDWLVHQQSIGYPVLVAEIQSDVAGWSSFSDFRDTSKRPGYRFTVENTVHVRQDMWRQGLGRALMFALIDAARRLGKHVMVAAVGGENLTSIAFHERIGFVEVARMPELGAKFGRWHDLVLLQLNLDERANP